MLSKFWEVGTYRLKSQSFELSKSIFFDHIKQQSINMSKGRIKKKIWS